MADLLMQQRQAALPQFLPPEAAVKQALAQPGGPIISEAVDSADAAAQRRHPGVGRRRCRAMRNWASQEGTIVMADAEAVTACCAAGQGAVNSQRGRQDRPVAQPAVAVTGVVRASPGILR
ncbi:MAG: hypothetical protein U0401_28705 [Anaerolineae bacterium]